MKTPKPPQDQRSESKNAKKLARLKPDSGWIRARRALLRQMKDEVRSRLGAESHDLKSFRSRYERELGKAWKISSKGELLQRIERCDIVFAGDFHALGQAQRTHLKILRSLSTDRPVGLALECFPRSAQKWLDQFLEGKINEAELRRRTHWDKSWGFPWENYLPLFELAKRRGFRLYGLNESTASKLHGDLDRREENAAAALGKIYLSHPGSLIYVIFGDMHLAARHLPAKFGAELNQGSKGGRTFDHVVIHLNSEKIYFSLAKGGLELAVDVVKFNEHRFCVMGSPPWVQWQSYLLFLERAENRGGEGHFDSDENMSLVRQGNRSQIPQTASAVITNGHATEDDEVFDPTDAVADLIRLAARDLGVSFKIDDLAVYSAEDNQIWHSLERQLKTHDRVIARQLLARGRSFFVPKLGLGYLAETSVNHAATIAGQYIHARLCGRDRTLWNLPADFSALIWTEAVSYYISKLINHKRQSETLSDLRAQLAMSGESDRGREAMRLALDRLMGELVLVRQGRLRPQQVKPRQKSSYLEAARVLGGMLGERLYWAHRTRHLASKEILQLLKLDVTHRRFLRDYEDILRRLSGIAEHQTPTRRERL